MFLESCYKKNVLLTKWIYEVIRCVSAFKGKLAHQTFVFNFLLWSSFLTVKVKKNCPCKVVQCICKSLNVNINLEVKKGFPSCCFSSCCDMMTMIVFASYSCLKYINCNLTVIICWNNFFNNLLRLTLSHQNSIFELFFFFFMECYCNYIDFNWFFFYLVCFVKF